MVVEMALRSMAEEDGGGRVQLEEFVVSGKSRVMVLGIDRTRLMKELPESASFQFQDRNQQVANGGLDVNGGVWMGPGDPNMQKLAPVFSGGAPRMTELPRGMGLPPLHRPLMEPNVPMAGPNSMPHKLKTEEDDIMKDVKALLNNKSFKEMEKLRTDEELMDLLHRPTAKETAVAAKFKTKGGSQLKEYCSSLTKEDCRRQSGSFIACEKMYSLLERISPRTRKLELFARMHNTHAGWISPQLVDEGLRARFKAAYPNVEVEPASPPRSSMEVDSGAAQLRSPFAVSESKPAYEDPLMRTLQFQRYPMRHLPQIKQLQ